MIDNYPAGYDELEVLRQALALQQQGAQQPMQFPQATPAQQYYGPAHQAISQLFQQSLMQQAQPSLLAPPTAQQMGLLSTDMPAFTAVPLEIGETGTLGPNEFYRLSPDYFQNVRMDTKTGEVYDARNVPATTRPNQFAPRGNNARTAPTTTQPNQSAPRARYQNPRS